MNKNILKKALYLTLIFLPSCKGVGDGTKKLITMGTLGVLKSFNKKRNIGKEEEEMLAWDSFIFLPQAQVKDWDEEEVQVLVLSEAEKKARWGKEKKAYDEAEEEYNKWANEVNLLAEMPQNTEIIIDQEALLYEEAEEEEAKRGVEAILVQKQGEGLKSFNRAQKRLAEEARQAQILEEQRLAEAERCRVAKIESRRKARQEEQERQAQAEAKRERVAKIESRRQAQILEEQERLAEEEAKRERVTTFVLRKIEKRRKERAEAEEAQNAEKERRAEEERQQLTYLLQTKELKDIMFFKAKCRRQAEEKRQAQILKNKKLSIYEREQLKNRLEKLKRLEEYEERALKEHIISIYLMRERARGINRRVKG